MQPTLSIVRCIVYNCEYFRLASCAQIYEELVLRCSKLKPAIRSILSDIREPGV